MSTENPFQALKGAVDYSWVPVQINHDPQSERLGVDDIRRARKMVDIAFKDKIRSASGEPYVSHLIETEILICQSGYSDDVAMRIAALLHDGPEDTPETLSPEVIRENFGQDVARLVEGVTKQKSIGQPWKEGWELFIEKLSIATDERIIIIELADRNSNLRDALRNSISQDAANGRKVGRRFWDIYKTSTPEDQLWMYEEMLKLFRKRAKGRTTPLLEDYEANVSVLRDVIEAYSFQDQE